MKFNQWIFNTACFILAYENVLALPHAPHVVEGRASVHSTPSECLIEAADRTIIQWDDFSIAANESVHFSLPSSQAAVLNRVVGGNPSELFGSLHSNGALYLINPHGILIGKEGLIHVGSLLASTLDVSNRDFLEGKELLFSGSAPSLIDNQGRIITAHGDLLLLAEQIINQGDLFSPQGMIVMGAGREITYLPYGNEKIQITLQPQMKTGDEPIGITQQGLMRARDIELKADGNLYSYAIKQEGIAEALSIENRNGHIYLVAEGGVTYHSGSLTAPEVHVLGDHVRIEEQARIDASSPEGGGTILIGGDYQGSNPDILNASTTVVGEQATLSADATVKGEGGKIIVWADGITGFYGTANVNAGREGGNGGFVEVSGKADLDFQGLVYAKAPQGKMGSLLLDPTNITISAAATSNITPTGCPAYTTIPTPGTTANILNTDLNTNLNSCSITISTAGAGGQAGTILITAPITWSSDNSLTLTANSGITVSADITNTTSNVASLTLTSGLTTASTLTISSGATVNLSGTSSAGSGTLTLTSNAVATSDMTITGAVIATHKHLDISCADDFTLNAGTGSITFNSPGKTFSYSTGLAAGSISTFNGAVTITDGDVLFTTGTLTINDGFSTAGSGNITINPNAAMTVGAAATLSHGSSGLFNLASTAAKAITFNSPFTQTGGDVAISAGAGLTLNGYTNSSLASTTTLQSGTLAAGTLTLAAGTIMSSTSSGTFTLDANTSVSSDITLSGALTIAGSDLNILLNDDFTLTTGTGSILFNSPGKMFTYTTGAGTGSVSNFNGPVTITDGDLLFSTGRLNINNPLVINGAGAASITSSGTVTTSAAGTITMNSPGTFTLSNAAVNNSITLGALFTQAGGDVTINAGTGLTVNNYTNSSTSSTTTLSSGNFAAGTLTLSSGATLSSTSSGLFTLNAATSLSSDITLSGALTIAGSDLNILLDDDFTLTATTGSILFNSPGKTFTYTVSTPATSTSTFNGPVTITDGHMAFNTGALNINNPLLINGTGTVSIIAGGAVSANASGTLTMNSPSTFMLSNAAVNSAITLGALFTQAGGNVTIDAGAALSINGGYTNNTTSSTTTLISGNFAAGTLTLGAAAPFTYGSAGNLLLLSGSGGDININNAVTITSAHATIAPSDDFTLASTGSITYSAVGKNLTFSPGPSTSATFNGPLTVTAGNLSITTFDDLTIGPTPGLISYNVIGGTCQLIATAGADPDVVINGTLDMLSGTLTISAGDDILLGAGGVFNHSAPTTATLTATASGSDSAISLGGTTNVSDGAMVITASTGISIPTSGIFTWTSPGSLHMTTTTPAATSAVSLAGTIAYSGGPWSINSQGDVSVTGFGVPFTYNSLSALSPFTILSHLGTITLSRAMDFITPSAFSLTTLTGDINIPQGIITNTSTGPWTFSAADDLFLGEHDSVNPTQVGSAGGAMFITAGDSIFITSSTETLGANAILGFSSGGAHPDMTITATNGMRMESYEGQEASIRSPGALTMTLGGDLIMTGTNLASGTGQTVLEAYGNLTVSAENITLIGTPGGQSVHTQTLTGDLLFIANTSISAIFDTHIYNYGSGSLTLVVDQQAPLPPAVGSGLLSFFGASLLETNGGPISLFAASPSQTTLPSAINGLPVSAGSAVFNTWYSTFSGTGSFPYTIFYKTAGISPPPPPPSPTNLPETFHSLAFASAQVNQQWLERTMSWQWLTRFNSCYTNPSECLKRSDALYQREPFEYPLFVQTAPCQCQK